MPGQILRVLFAGGFGLIFGLGLILSGMTDPARVIGFLDVAGDWNPSLAVVMAAAIAVALPAFAVARRRGQSLLGEPIRFPDRFRIDRRLTLGAALFGVGWGLSGMCPGPAIVLLGAFPASAAIFVGAMIAGIWLADWVGRARKA